jgi:hypothetical protein
MRSEWERLVAAYLDKNREDWVYEPRVIQLPDGRAYVPDFYLPKRKQFIEVKGYMTSGGLEKITKARKMGFNILVYNMKKLKSLGILTSSGLKAYREKSKSSTSRPKAKTSTIAAS